MKTRIIVGIILLALLAAILAVGGIAIIITISVVSFAAVYETAHITINSHPFRPHTFPAYVCAIAMPFVGYFGGFEPMIAFYMFMIAVAMIGLVLRRPEEPQNAIVSLLFFVYPLALILCLLGVFLKQPECYSFTMTLLVLVTPILSDTFAYFGGSFFGKHKLCPAISPKKTIEGSVAGAIAGIISAVVLYLIQFVWNGAVSFSFLMVCGILCAVAGQFGDLFASLLKRWAGVKDYSNLFPGHGGIMDRLDSILICAPVVYFVFVFCHPVFGM